MRLLAILYCYPPLLVPASICYLKLALGLVQRGVDLEILTITPDSFDAPAENLRDDSLLNLAPTGVVEHRVHSPESSLVVRALKRFDRRRRFTYPFLEPKKREWIRPALRLLSRMDMSRFDAILSCSQPHTNHLLAMEVKRRTQLPWLAYFSDPWSDNPYAQFPSPRVARYNRELEDAVLEAADRVLYTSPEMLRLVLAKHPVLQAQKTGVLPHAFVPAWYDVAPDAPEALPSGGTGRVRLLHTGHFYGPRTPEPLFDALTSLQSRSNLAGKVEITSYGGMPERFVTLAQERGLRDVLHLRGTVPYLQSLALMRRFDGLVLVDAKVEDSTESVFLPSKLVDYLGAEKPIIALTPAEGATARVVGDVGGLVCDLRDQRGIDAAFAGLAESGCMPRAMQHPAAAEYEVSRVAARLAGDLEVLLRHSPRKRPGAPLSQLSGNPPR